MEAITKTFITIFCLLLITFTASGLIIASLNASTADSFLSDAVIGIEEGNLQTSVINAYKNEAAEKGYELSAIEKDVNGDGYTDIVDLTLKYQYYIPFINSNSEEHVIKAYVR